MWESESIDLDDHRENLVDPVNIPQYSCMAVVECLLTSSREKRKYQDFLEKEKPMALD